ncbi:MAG: quaternary ammonium compound efflux SMR transporter SugE [Candidatus Adiutrix sp.]|jgi:quaternary ammonium compound-resistance protein SugE|nr:quaternary ammonium compound efflux SMR transporter SugE [Candidatus Adiutrix sp.]
MVWLTLFIAGLFETAWAVGLKYTHGFSRLGPSVFTLGAMFVSVLLLSRCMKTLPVGTAYAVWTGVGAVGAVILGVALFHEPLTWPRMLCLALIISGIIGLKLAGH